MKKRFFKTCLLAVCIQLIALVSTVRGQVSVDYLTGASNVSLPLHTFNWGRISIPISLNYYSNGVRTKDVEGNAGMGWNLSAGGSISRELRDLPDDLVENNRGLLYNTNLSKIAAFSIANDNNSSTCWDENADLTYLANQFGSMEDTEPDIFHINVPGISCKLIFDANHQPRTIRYTDIKVSYTTDYWGIRAFKIVTDKGMVYDFEQKEMAYRKSDSANVAGIKFFKDVYDKYATQVTYCRRWLLTKITDDANVLALKYSVPGNRNKFSKIPYEFYIGNSSSKTKQFIIEEYGPHYGLDTIMVPFSHYNVVAFGNSSNPYTGMPMVSGVSTAERTWNFSYDQAKTDTTKASYTRLFLSSVSEVGVSSPTGYKFYYEGVIGSQPGNRLILLQDSTSTKLDRWGYYDADPNSTLPPQVYINPSNTSLDRFRPIYNATLSASYPYFVSGKTGNPNLLVNKAGLLNKVVDIKGSETRIYYESNSYYDPQAQENVSGGGLRVAKIQEFDQADVSKKKTITYSYVDPGSGNSSGKPISLPVFAFLRPYAGSGTTEQKWQESVVRSDENLSSESTNIIYGHVREAIAGMGSKRFTFVNPATHFDVSASPDWAPVVSNVAGCGGAGFLTNEKNTYPFAYNLDVNFERGRLDKLQLFNESNQKVSQTNYSYSRIGTAAYIPGLKQSLNNGITTYVKYQNVVGITNETVTQIDTLYDLANNSQQASTVSYAYESANHLYPTKVERSSSDGSITTVRTKYSKDYNLGTANEAAVLALKEMVNRNINQPIEKYTQVTRDGNTRTIASELVTFDKFAKIGIDLYKPKQALSFTSAAGISDFAVSTISGGYLAKDSRYIPKVDFLDYNERGLLVASKPVNGKVSSTMYQEYSFIPKAIITNALPGEIVNGDFEYLWFVDIIELGLPDLDTIGGRSGKRSHPLGGSTEVAINFSKKPSVPFYIFSAWIKAPSSSSLNITVGNGSANVVRTLPFVNSAEWKYYQLRIPVSNISGSAQLKVSSSANINIDDILFYPADATVSTQTTDHFKHVKTSETSTNGQARYYDYDAFNRLKNVYDGDKNILLKKSYVLVGDLERFKLVVSHNFGSSGSMVYHTPYLFTADSGQDLKDGIVYTWNFGDGSPVVTSSGGSLLHTYTALGNYTLSVSKYSPLLGTVTYTELITITIPPSVRLLSGGGMNITVYQGTAFEYNSELDLLTGNVSLVPGSYTFKINSFDALSPSNPYGFRSIYYRAYGPNDTLLSEGCVASSPGVNNYSIPVNITGKEKITFFLNYTQDCSIGIGEF